MVLAVGGRALVGGGIVAVLLCAGCGRRAATAGVWYDDTTFALPAHAAEKLGGQLTARELDSIKVLSSAEVERAFAGFNLHIGDDRTAF